jgi:hypothetical protein
MLINRKDEIKKEYQNFEESIGKIIWKHPL